ncbi:unnamed protein product [Brassica oleracea]
MGRYLLPGAQAVLYPIRRGKTLCFLLGFTDVIVYLSLWDEAASTFRGLLKAGDKTKSVMLVTTVNPKLFGGNMYLNSTPGTRFFRHQPP